MKIFNRTIIYLGRIDCGPNLIQLRVLRQNNLRSSDINCVTSFIYIYSHKLWAHLLAIKGC